MTDQKGATPENPIDPQNDDSAAEHVQTFLASDGAEPALRAPMLLITTRGRKSHAWQRTAIFYAPDGDDILVFASNRAGAKDPAWYLNLVEDPEVHVQLPGRAVRTSARVLSGGEREDAWQKLIAVFPPYVEHQEKVERTIGIVRLEPAG